MKQPIWIDPEIVIAIHKRQIAEHGGYGGVKDQARLASALMRPQQKYAYRATNVDADIFMLAAAYGFSITQNHPFHDGNKRIGYITMRLFLKLNGYDINASQAEKYRIMMRLAAGKISETMLADWLRKHKNR